MCLTRSLTLEVSERNWRSGARRWKAPEPSMKGGYQGLYVSHVQQANHGRRPGFPGRMPRVTSTVTRESH